MIEDDIDKKILRLVRAMNKTGWIETLFSCEGHPDDDYRTTPYIMFYCKVERIDFVSEIFSDIAFKAGKEKIDINLVLMLVHDRRKFVYSQFAAPPGFLSLIGDFKLEDLKNNGRVLEIAAEEFEGWKLRRDVVK